MKNGNRNVEVVQKNTVVHLVPGGRGWHAVPGEGVLKEVGFMNTPSSPLRGTSPARGEVNGGFTRCRHAEFISASSLYDNNKILKQVQDDDLFQEEALKKTLSGLRFAPVLRS